MEARGEKEEDNEEERGGRQWKAAYNTEEEETTRKILCITKGDGKRALPLFRLTLAHSGFSSSDQWDLLVVHVVFLELFHQAKLHKERRMRRVSKKMNQ